MRAISQHWEMHTAFLINEICVTNFSLISTKHLRYQLNCQIAANTKPDQVNSSIIRRALRKDKNRQNDK